MLRLFAIIYLAISTGCSSPQPILSPSNIGNGAKITVLYQSNRRGTVKPMKELGGIHREAQAVSIIRGQELAVLYVDAGNAFSKRAVESEKIAKALDGVGLNAFAPGQHDYALGVHFLKRVAEKVRFPFLSSNVLIGGTPVFHPYTRWESQGVSFFILSITPEFRDPILKVEDPDIALKKWMALAKGPNDFVLVLSQLDIASNEALAERFPEIQLIVGADATRMLELPWWGNGRNLMVDPPSQGTHLGRIDIHFRLPFMGFSSLEALDKSRRQLAEASQRFERNRSDKTAQNNLFELLRVPIKMEPGRSQYFSEMIALDGTRFGN